MIGEQLKKLRGDMPQQTVADRMVAMGHTKWSQSTVWAVEKGTRPLRLTEAHSMGVILTVPMGALFGDPALVAVHSRSMLLQRKHWKLMDAVIEFLDTREILREAIEEAARLGVSAPQLERGRWDHMLLTIDPAELIRQSMLDDGPVKMRILSGGRRIWQYVERKTYRQLPSSKSKDGEDQDDEATWQTWEGR